eukprot:TRINITY_DN2834_c0_g1_i1.p1 TRINITY_DN2834_c0_g1~~TRINITY_DN2834_c0_g1_i1.p1  ORF type:complete len:170 (+),score=35.75 TRINITY_DN2834_c0_g1_i1:45-554(+)
MIFLRFHRLSSLRTGFRAFSAESRESPNSSKGFSNPLFLLFPIPITFALGTWQVKRHFWKQELLKAVDENLHQPPTDLPQDFTANALQFRPIRIQGVYDHSQEVLVGPRAHKGKNGFHLITPMDLIDGYPPVLTASFQSLFTKEIIIFIIIYETISFVCILFPSQLPPF